MKKLKEYSIKNKHNQTLKVSFIKDETGKRISLNGICFETSSSKFTALETFKNLKKVRTYFLKSNSPMPNSWNCDG